MYLMHDNKEQNPKQSTQEEKQLELSHLSGTEKFFESLRPREVLFGLLSNAFP